MSVNEIMRAGIHALSRLSGVSGKVENSSTEDYGRASAQFASMLDSADSGGTQLREFGDRDAAPVSGDIGRPAMHRMPPVGGTNVREGMHPMPPVGEINVREGMYPMPPEFEKPT